MDSIYTYEKFNLFRKKSITQEDIYLISDLFLEISDNLREIDYRDRYGVGYVNQDSFTIDGVIGSHVEITIYLSFSDGDHFGISWISDEVKDKCSDLNKKIHSFIDRLRKYKFKVSVDLPEHSPGITILYITR